MKMVRVRGLALLAAGLIAYLGVVACGDGDDVTSTNPPLTQTARVTVAPTPTGTATGNRADEVVKSG